MGFIFSKPKQKKLADEICKSAHGTTLDLISQARNAVQRQAPSEEDDQIEKLVCCNDLVEMCYRGIGKIYYDVAVTAYEIGLNPFTEAKDANVALLYTLYALIFKSDTVERNKPQIEQVLKQLEEAFPDVKTKKQEREREIRERSAEQSRKHGAAPEQALFYRLLQYDAKELDAFEDKTIESYYKYYKKLPTSSPVKGQEEQRANQKAGCFKQLMKTIRGAQILLRKPSATKAEWDIFLGRLEGMGVGYCGEYLEIRWTTWKKQLKDIAEKRSDLPLVKKEKVARRTLEEEKIGVFEIAKPNACMHRYSLYFHSQVACYNDFAQAKLAASTLFKQHNVESYFVDNTSLDVYNTRGVLADPETDQFAKNILIMYYDQ